MRAVPVGGQLTAHPPKERTRAAGSVPLLKEMPHISNISNVSNRYSGCEVLRCFWSGATVSILQKVSYRKYLGPVRSRRAFTRPLNEREKEIAPREATMSQLSRERERKRGAKRRAKSKITSVFLMVLIFLIFLVFLIVIVATSEIRCSLAGSLRWLSALEFTSLWLGVLGRHYLSSALLSGNLT